MNFVEEQASWERDTEQIWRRWGCQRENVPDIRYICYKVL